MVTTWKIINYENGKSKNCKNIQSLRIDNEEITNQNTTAIIFSSYCSSIAETLNSGNNKHFNIKEANPINYLTNSFHRLFPKMIWQYSSTQEVEKVSKSLKSKNSSGNDEISTQNTKIKCTLHYISPDIFL